MSSVFILGSMNLDHAITVEKQPLPGETVLGKTLQIFPGGKGANQAVAAARLGAEVRMYGLLGHDASGQQMLGALTEEGVETSLIGFRGQASGSAFLTVSGDGENSIIVIQGANALLEPSDISVLEGALSADDIVVTQLEIPVSAVTAGVDAAKRAGARVILNAAPAKDIGNLIENVDVLVLNQHEVEFLVDVPVGNPVEALEVARSITDRSGPVTIVTLGAQGAVFADGNRAEHVPSEWVPVVDTTGAGDTFVGALATALAQGSEMRRAVEFASSAAAIACTALGAQNSMPYRKQLSMVPDARTLASNETGLKTKEL